MFELRRAMTASHTSSNGLRALPFRCRCLQNSDPAEQPTGRLPRRVGARANSSGLRPEGFDRRAVPIRDSAADGGSIIRPRREEDRHHPPNSIPLYTLLNV